MHCINEKKRIDYIRSKDCDLISIQSLDQLSQLINEARSGVFRILDIWVKN